MPAHLIGGKGRPCANDQDDQSSSNQCVLVVLELYRAGDCAGDEAGAPGRMPRGSSRGVGGGDERPTGKIGQLAGEAKRSTGDAAQIDVGPE